MSSLRPLLLGASAAGAAAAAGSGVLGTAGAAGAVVSIGLAWMLESVSAAWLWLAAASSAALSGIDEAIALPLMANTVPPPAIAKTAAAARTKPQRRFGRIAMSSRSRLVSRLLVTGAKLSDGAGALGAM